MLTLNSTLEGFPQARPVLSLLAEGAEALQGGLIVGLFAVLIYDAMAQLERYLSRRMGG